MRHGPRRSSERPARRTWLVLCLATVSGCDPSNVAPVTPKGSDVKRAEPQVSVRPLPDLAKGVRGRTPVLTYHDFVTERGPKTLWFDCTLDEFKGQLERLESQGAVFVSMDALYDHLVLGKAIHEKAVVITFADNYLGFYKLALPELRRRRIPATMFVHTGFVGSPVGRPKMTWPQLRELAREGLVTLASQTVSHPADLSKLDDSAMVKELSGSKARLEKELGVAVRFLAYPNGKFDRRCAEAARKAGYAMAFTEEQRPAESAHDAWTVPRYVHTKWWQAWRDKRAPNRS